MLVVHNSRLRAILVEQRGAYSQARIGGYEHLIGEVREWNFLEPDAYKVIVATI